MFLNPNIRSINGIKSHELLKVFLPTNCMIYMKALTDLISYMMTFFGNWNKPLIGQNSFLTQPFLLDMSRSSPGEESRSLADKCQNCAKNGIILSRKYIGTVSWVLTQVRARYFPPSFFFCFFHFLLIGNKTNYATTSPKSVKNSHKYIEWTEAAIFLQFFVAFCPSI